VQAIRQVSHDPTLAQTVALRDGRRLSALDVQWQLLEHAKKYERERGLVCVGEEVGPRIIRRWEEVLAGLEHDRASVATVVDWVAKERLLLAYRDRHDIGWGDPRLQAMDLQYHDARADKSLFARLNMERITTDAEVVRATTEPPLTTRAYFRGKCLQKWAPDIVAANWDSMVFDIGSDPLRRVPMMEPLRGTVQHVGVLLDECDTAAELLDRLGAH
jgi:proteasome accessory factor A